MRRWFEGGAGGSGNAAGDGAPAPAETAPETAPAPEVEPAEADAQAAADRARDEHIASIAAQAAARAVQDWASRQPAPAAPAAPPPTAGRREVAELQAEAAAIAAEEQRLRAAFTRDGMNAQNLYDQAELTRRETRFAAQVSLLGLQDSERRQAIDSRAPKDDEARAKAFKAYAAEHPNVDPDLLSDAFATKWSREHPEKAAEAPARQAPNGKQAVNVSGPSEVSAREVRARTMTREQANQHRATLRADGRDRDAAAFDRDIRNGKVLVKG